VPDRHTHRVYSQCVCIVCALGEYHGILPPTASGREGGQDLRARICQGSVRTSTGRARLVAHIQRREPRHRSCRERALQDDAHRMTMTVFASPWRANPRVGRAAARARGFAAGSACRSAVSSPSSPSRARSAAASCTELAGAFAPLRGAVCTLASAS
jgi:hypothetical protein